MQTGLPSMLSQSLRSIQLDENNIIQELEE